MVISVESLSLDPRKWRLFLPIGYRECPEDHTKESIFEYRLWEASEHLKYAKYGERFPPSTFPRMLMIGAGTGAEVKAAEQFGYKVIGVGLLNPEQVEYANQQGADFRIMDMHDLKFPNESFDVAYSSHSFEHCVNPWLVCMEVWAVLRPYGRWWINLPTWQHSDKDGPSNQHFMILPPWFMKPMFMRSGFKILYFEDNKMRYQYLLERLPLEAIDVELAPHKAKSIVGLLRRRLEIGRGYK